MIPEDVPPEGTDEAGSPRPRNTVLLWAALLFATNLFCLLLLAARSESPAHLRGYFDVAIFTCLAGVVTFAIARFMFQYPFRLLDLLVIVITLSLGMRGAIAIADWTRHGLPNIFAGAKTAPAFPDASLSVLYVESCMLTACVLLGGAALGLRNCRLLKVEAPLKRAIVLVFGMAALPAPAGLVAIPFYLLNGLMRDKQTTADALGWIAALVFSFAATVANASFSVRAMALTTQNSGQETAWRKK